ncbi:DUF4430 domain-containing protein [Aerococcaceae bacterium WGS1372]
MKKLLLLLSSILLLAACGQTTEKVAESTVTETVETAESTENQEVVINVTVSVDGEVIEDGEQDIEVEDGQNLLELMEANFDVEQTDGFISSINGYEQDDESGKYWLYDVNGEMAEVGAADLKLSDGDQIEWKLEAFEG